MNQGNQQSNLNQGNQQQSNLNQGNQQQSNLSQGYQQQSNLQGNQGMYGAQMGTTEGLGSSLTGSEKDLRKYDDWHSHKYEHNRDPNAVYREGELHGAVGKEIYDVLKQDKQQQGSNIQGSNMQGFQGSNMQGFQGSNMQGQGFQGSNMQRQGFQGSNMQSQGFQGYNIQGQGFQGSNIQSQGFQGSNIQGQGFWGFLGSKIRQAFHSLNMQGQGFQGSNMQGSNMQAGSSLQGEEKELRKYDDWHAHKYEHNRDLQSEYRQGDLHGVVGKEIKDVLKCDSQQRQDKYMYNQPGHQQYQSSSQQQGNFGQTQFENVGSTLTGEEKEQRKYDGWHAHKYEHNRDPNAEYREGELHGVVGKEINDLLRCEREKNMQQQSSGMQSGFQQSGQSGFQQSGQSGFQQSGQSGFQQSGQSGFQQSGQSGIQQSGQSGNQQSGQFQQQSGMQSGDIKTQQTDMYQKLSELQAGSGTQQNRS